VIRLPRLLWIGVAASGAANISITLREMNVDDRELAGAFRRLVAAATIPA